MARRVIATAEVQVAANIGQAEAGLEGLTETFRKIGSIAERAAERAEVAFLNGSRGMAQGLQNVEKEVFDLLSRMEQVNDVGAEMSRTFFGVYSSIRKAAAEGASLEEQATSWLNLFKQAAGAVQALEENLQDADVRAQAVADAAQMVEGELRAAGYRAEQLERAFRDVGQAIDLAMAGGLEGVQDDIRDTIRRLDDLGGEFRDVGRIGETALDGILSELDSDADQATSALMRLERQLQDVAQIGDTALASLDNDARQAAAALGSMSAQAERADRSIDGIGNVSRRVSRDVSGLVGLLGAAGLGYAAASAARAGLDMTVQLEKSEAMFLGLTGSVEGAADMLERMVLFARETPYNLANVSEAAAQLLAVGDDFGVTSQNIEQYLTVFGDAIAMTGGSEDQFIRIVRVLGQMSSTGKVLGQDMNQLAQNLPGYDVWSALAEGAGTSVQELRRLQDLGQLDNLLTGNEAVQILIEGMKGIPGAAGAMERRVATLGGAIEKFRETAQFAASEGLIPFSETAQDVLSDPVILNSVEDLSFAFGDLLSGALEDVRPELDDLAASVETLLIAFEDWTPVLTTAVDALGDFINFVSPFVSFLGKATEAVLGFGDGLGKLGAGAALAATGNPFGIAAGAVLAVSGALDLFTDNNEDAANMARLLAAAQGDVNDAMAVGEEVVLSEAQQLALDTATELTDKYPELAAAMASYGVNVRDLQLSMDSLAAGTGAVTPELQALIDNFNRAEVDSPVADQLQEQIDAYRTLTDVASVEAAKQADISVLAATEEIGALEERDAAIQAYVTATSEYWANYSEQAQARLSAAKDQNDEWGELDAERTEALAEILNQQAEDYLDWEASINESTDGAALSLSSVAEEAENSARRMIDAINENNAATFAWKNNIVTAATSIQERLGLTDEKAQEFMGTLGEMGPAAAPALQEMINDFNNNGTLLEEFFNSTQMNAAVMSSSLTDEFDKVTGAAPGLAEGLAEGTLTVEQVLAALPAAMEQAGIDLETAASMIDASDEMGTVGDEAVNGLVSALTNSANIAKVRVASTDLGSIVAAATAAALRVSSPSRVMFDIGEFVVEGLVKGMQDMSDEAYVTAVQTASLISGGIADHFRKAEDPQEEARKFAEDVANAIIDELIAEQEAVADAAEALAEAAADRLAEAWDRVKDRFKNRDIQEGVTEALAELEAARAELAAAESLAGAGGTAAMAAAEERVQQAQAALAIAEEADAQADLLAEQIVTNFQRGAEDAVAALRKQQEAEIAATQARIATATRNLDPVARAAAEADLAATKERHEAEMTALERRNQDDEEALQRRLDNENTIREATIDARQDELDAFEDALDDIVKSITDAIENLPDLRAGIGGAERNVQEAYFDQFEQMLENVNSVDRGLLSSIGARAGLTATEVSDLIETAIASDAANQGASAANLGLDQLLDMLSTGLYTIGANGALGIAAGLSDTSYAIAKAMWASVQTAITTTLANLEIRSPSRVTGRLIGEPMAQGIANGIMAGTPEVNSAMAGLIDNVMGGVNVPSSSQLVDNGYGASGGVAGVYSGPLVTMPGAIIQDATDADLVAQRVALALSATGNY